MLLKIIAVLRIIVPLFIFKYPFETTFVYSFLLDNPDGYVAYKAGWSWRRYHFYDKILDYFWYIFILLYSRQTPLFPIFLGLFLWRSVGQLVAILTSKTKIFMFFPGVIEVYFMIYVISLKISNWSYLFSDSYKFATLLIAVIISLFREYILHVVKFSISGELFGIRPKWK